MNFRIKEKFILRISGAKGDIFQRRKLIEIRDLHNVLRTEKVIFQSSKKGRTKQSKTKNSRFDILFTMEYRLLFATEPSFWIFWGWKIRSFLSQNFDGNMIFTDIWKVLVLKFSGMGNTVFFETKSWWKDDIYSLLKSSCFELFGDGKYGLFLAKKLMQR